MGKARARNKERPLWVKSDKHAPDKATQRAVNQALATALKAQGIQPGQAAAKKQWDQTAVNPRERRAPWRKTELPAPAFRFRYQLVPVWWALWAATGLIAYATGTLVLAAMAASAVTGCTLAFTRHRKQWPRLYNQAMACWCSVWVIVLAALGPGPWLAAGIAGWLAPSAAWIHHHRWRPQPQPKAPQASTWVEELFAKLACKQRWAGNLVNSRDIPGGRQWDIMLHGVQTNIGDLLSRPDAIAATFDKPVTEAYVEPSPSGIKSRGVFTLLTSSTLEAPRAWDGTGIDLATGLAVVGRFPDGKPVHERIYVPGIGGGARHSIIAGADGSGKTGKLDLSLAISALSGRISSVVLDPQEGQALPAWQDHVPYARGTEQCLTYLRGLHAAMMSRSAFLASLNWANPKTGRVRKGMGFYDYELCGLPLVEIVIDEAPILLKLPDALALVLAMAKLGRKVGFRLVLAAQVPSIAELGQGELRAMLVGGNVWCYRTADKVSGGMVNIKADPWELPKYWRDGLTTTVGLGYTDGPDNRPASTMRTDWIEDPYEVAETTPMRPLDDSVAGHLAAAIAAAEAGEVEHQAQESRAQLARRTVLAELRRTPRDRGTLAAIGIAAGLTLTEVSNAIDDLREQGQIFESRRGFEAA